MDTNKYESGVTTCPCKTTISILETLQQQGTRQIKHKLEFFNLGVIINNHLSCFSWFKHICVNLCPSVVPNFSVSSVYSVVKTGVVR